MKLKNFCNKRFHFGILAILLGVLSWAGDIAVTSVVQESQTTEVIHTEQNSVHIQFVDIYFLKTCLLSDQQYTCWVNVLNYHTRQAQNIYYSIATRHFIAHKNHHNYLKILPIQYEEEEHLRLG